MFTFAPIQSRALAAILATLSLGSVALLAPPAVAGTGLVVNTTNDELNADGDCSLREAIQAANTNAPVDFCGGGNSELPDVIVVPADTYMLTIPPGSTGDDDANQNGDLDVLGQTDFEVTGTGNAVVDGGASVDPAPETLGDIEQSRCIAIENGEVDPGNGSRIFHLQAPVSMESFTVRGGYIETNTGTVRGAGILSQSDLDLSNSTVEDNFAVGLTITETDDGDGSGGGISSSGVLELTNSVLRRNTAAGLNGIGGGLDSTGPTTATATNFNFNNACGDEFSEGGGIAASDSTTMTDVQIIGNHSESYGSALGGGLRVFATDPGPTFDLVNSTVADNAAGTFEGPALGGGIHNSNVLTVATTTIRDNRAVGGFDGAEGGGIFNEASLDLVRSTLNGNTAEVFLVGGGEREPQGKGSFALGGAISQQGLMEVTNSTIAENDAQAGAGIFAGDSSTSSLFHATIAENDAGDIGGGIAAGFANDVSLRATIVAHNTGGDCYEESKGSPFFSLGSNLDTDNSCNLDEATKNDKQGQDPFLGDLQDNGGPTETMALAPDSPAVDAVVPVQVPTQGGSGGCPPPQIDQRGVERPKDGDGEGPVRCDMGAFELRFTAPTPEACPGFEPNDPRNQVIGTPNADTLKGTNGVDIICGFKGNDTLRGLDGNDIILGGLGKDTMLGGDGADLINGDDGDDTIEGGGGSDKLKGRFGDDDVRGDDGGDVVRGGVGDDDVYGGSADDQVFGGIGADDIFGNRGKDRLYGKPGADHMEGGADRDRLRGGKAYDTLDGGDDIDRCHTQEGGGARINCELGE